MSERPQLPELSPGAGQDRQQIVRELQEAYAQLDEGQRQAALYGKPEPVVEQVHQVEQGGMEMER